MNKIYLLIIILLTACSNGYSNKDFNDNFKFSKKMSFEEFKIRVRDYANQSSFPSIKD